MCFLCKQIWFEDEYSTFLTFSPRQSEDRGAVPCNSRENPTRIGIFPPWWCLLAFRRRNVFKNKSFLPSGWEHWDGELHLGKSSKTPAAFRGLKKKGKSWQLLTRENNILIFLSKLGFCSALKSGFCPSLPSSEWEFLMGQSSGVLMGWDQLEFHSHLDDERRTQFQEVLLQTFPFWNKKKSN